MKRIIALIIMLLVVIGVVILILLSSLNKKVVTDIKEFEYTNSGGMDMNGNTIYRIKCDKECIATIKKPHELEKTNVKVDQETIDKLVEIFTEYNVSSWDGFDRVDQYVLDGSSFSFKVVTKDKKTISAHGYMKYPNNYFKVISDISDIFEELYNDGKAIYLFDTFEFKDFNINKINRVEIDKITEGGKETETIKDKEEIKKIYNKWKDVVLTEKCRKACEDNTIIYRFITEEEYEYTIEKECDWLVINNSRYYYK